MKPLISLVMILKDEAASIEKTLRSCLPAIDRWTILDTGSTDGTQDIIRRGMADVPGKLESGPFVDFSTTRNAALDLETEATFALMLSGDETLENPEALRKFCQEHESDSDGAYYVTLAAGADRWPSARLTRTASHWHYVGAVHEVLMGPNDVIPSKTVPDVCVRHEMLDENRRTTRYKRDLEILFKENQRDPTNTRTAFYLAQTYACLGKKVQAVEWYKKRIRMGGWREEVFESTLRLARLQNSWPEKLTTFIEAYNRAPHRCEPLYEIGLHYYQAGMPAVGLIFAQRAAEIPYPKGDFLFVVESYYRWQAHDLVACCAVGNRELALPAAQKALEGNPMDERLRQNVANLGGAHGPARTAFAVAIVSFLGYVHSSAFEDVAESVHQGLLELGIDSIRTDKLDGADRRLIVFGAHLLGASTLLPFDTIIYNLEQVGAANVTEAVLAFYKNYRVWDYSLENIRRLGEAGIVAEHLPLGYAKTLTRIEPVEEDIDVLFYGCLNHRRQVVIDELRARGVNVVVLESVYGAERDAYIARAKIVLNVHFYETKIFEVARVLYLLANRKCVVSEESVDIDFSGGFVVVPYDSLVDECCRLLADEAERARMAEVGFELVKERPAAEGLRQVLAL